MGQCHQWEQEEWVAELGALLLTVSVPRWKKSLIGFFIVCTFMRRKTAKVRQTGLPDELHSNEGWAEAFWDWELHCLLSSKDVRSCFMVFYERIRTKNQSHWKKLQPASWPYLQDAKHLAFQRNQRHWYPCFTWNTLAQPLCASSLSFQGYVWFNQSSQSGVGNIL